MRLDDVGEQTIDYFLRTRKNVALYRRISACVEMVEIEMPFVQAAARAEPYITDDSNFSLISSHLSGLNS